MKLITIYLTNNTRVQLYCSDYNYTDAGLFITTVEGITRWYNFAIIEWFEIEIIPTVPTETNE